MLTGAAFLTGALAGAALLAIGFFVATDFLAIGFFAGAALLATGFFAGTAFFAATFFTGAAFLAIGFLATAFFAGALAAAAFLATGFLATDLLATTFLLAVLTGFLTALVAFFTGFFAATGGLSFYSLVTGKRAVIPCPGYCGNRIARKFMIIAELAAPLGVNALPNQHLVLIHSLIMVRARIKEL